jgi:hypothetical protein
VLLSENILCLVVKSESPLPDGSPYAGLFDVRMLCIFRLCNKFVTKLSFPTSTLSLHSLRQVTHSVMS